MNVERRFGECGSALADTFNEKTALATEGLVDRLAKKIWREVEVVKLSVIMKTLTKPGASGPLCDVALFDCYEKIASLIDPKENALDAADDRYSICALIEVMQSRLPMFIPHFRRVNDICLDMGKMMGLRERDLLLIDALGFLHDVGKLGIENGILLKQGPLTPKEWESIKRHPAIGYKLIRPIHGISELADLVMAHHERWDGKGYPLGLQGKEIPLICRILSLADSADAMMDDRPYRKALSPSEIVAEIQRCSGSQFDPEVVEAFLDMIHERGYAAPFFQHFAKLDVGRSEARRVWGRR